MDPDFSPSSSSEPLEYQLRGKSQQVIDITNSLSEDSVIDLCQEETQLQFKGITAAVENMMEDVSAASKLVQVLMQQRTAEHAASSIEEYTSSSASECPVCREVLFASQACTTMCGHIFHLACIQKLAQYKRAKKLSCPICRADVHVGELITIKSGLPEGTAVQSLQPEREESEQSLTCKKKENPLDRAIKEALEALSVFSNEEKVFQKSLAGIQREARTVILQAKREAKAAKFKYISKVENMKGREREIQKTTSRIAEWEERLVVSQQKLNNDLAICAKQKSDLRAMEGTVEFKQKEVEQKSKELEEKLFEVAEKERRLAKLKDALRLKSQEYERKRSQSNISESPRQQKRRRPEPKVGETHTAQSNPFPSKVRLPSVLNRPPPPRRAGQKHMTASTLGLMSFAPKRSGIQRPVGGVAQSDSRRKRI